MTACCHSFIKSIILGLISLFCPFSSSLLVELTAHSSLSGEFYHQTAVDAYESAVHSLLDRDSTIAVWKEYLSHLRSISSNSTESLSQHFSCTRRCLQAVEFSLINSHAESGQQDHYEDYTFHNEVIPYLEFTGSTF